MSPLRLFLPVSLLALFYILLLTPPVHAQAPPPATALVIVIDNSGSMDGNDPYDLRYAATRLVLDVADDWDQIGVMCFGDAPAPIVPLEALGATRDNKTQGATKSACPVGSGTNMSAAVNAATQSLSNNQAPRRYILLLTDGAPNNLALTFTAIEDAKRQGIGVIPVALYPGQIGAGEQAFLDALQQLNIEARKVSNTNELFAEFAEIYGALKPDRYVAVLGGTDGAPEIRVNALQQVNRLTFVLAPQQGIIENDVSRSCANNPVCKQDSGGQYELYTTDQSPIEGIWRLPDPNQAAVVITRANFKPRLVFPPVEDEAQTGYFIGRGAKQTLIAQLEGDVESGAPISLNGEGFFLSSGQLTYMLNHFATEQNTAEVKLGSGNVPLVISKNFTLAAVPDPEPTLPQLKPSNPDEQGQVNLENDTEFRLAVEALGDLSLTPRLSVYALVFDTTTAEPVFGPEALQLSAGQYQSNQLLTLDPGIQYRVIFWLDAVRDRDGLRYGDQLDLLFSLRGGIRVNGLTNMTFEDFQAGSLPLTIDVTEANKKVDLQARLRWLNQPTSGDAGSQFTVQLLETQFEGLGTETNLRMTAPEDICTLPEGDYEGVIELTSASGLPVAPASAEVRDRVAYGQVEVLTNQAVELGEFCRLPGLLNVLCQRVSGNEELLRPKIAIEVPTCVNERDLEIRLENINPPDEAEIEPGELDRSSTPFELEILPSEIPPIALTIDSLRNRQEFVGNLAIGRDDQADRAGLAQVRYTKRSLGDTLTPWPFNESPMRVGNLVATITSAILLILGFFWSFGSGSPQQAPRRRGRGGNRDRDRNDDGDSGRTRTSRRGNSSRSSRTRSGRDSASSRTRRERNSSSSRAGRERSSSRSSRSRGRDSSRGRARSRTGRRNR